MRLPKNALGQKRMKPSHSNYTIGSDSCCNGTSVMVNWDPQNRETHIAGSSVAIPGTWVLGIIMVVHDDIIVWRVGMPFTWLSLFQCSYIGSVLAIEMRLLVWSSTM